MPLTVIFLLYLTTSVLTLFTWSDKSFGLLIKASKKFNSSSFKPSTRIGQPFVNSVLVRPISQHLLSR